MFLLRLRDVDKTSTLAELIISQHGKLEKVWQRIYPVHPGGKNQPQGSSAPGWLWWIHTRLKPTHRQGNRTFYWQLFLDSHLPSRFWVWRIKVTSMSAKKSEIKWMVKWSLKGLATENIVKCSTQYLDSKEKSESHARASWEVWYLWSSSSTDNTYSWSA